MRTCDIVVIGGGPAGLAAAIAAREAGISEILVLERDRCLGGILNQCIHNGFGLHTFREELTGPEYAERFIRRAEELEIPCLLETMVMDITPGKVVTAMNREDGVFQIQAGAVILAMGCRERPRGALNIPGYRPAGIYSAGTAQRLVNIEGYMPGREVVILGSGDIGLIMARRMTLEGARVHAVAELMPYSGGLKRNIVQCLDDYGIPLKLSHTVVQIHGKERLTGVTLAKVGADRKPVPGTEEFIPCDTLLLSVGLIPENELSGEIGVEMNRITNGPSVNESLETSAEGVFACGNVLHVHDLVDYVSQEAALAGKNAARYVMGDWKEGLRIQLEGKGGVRYTVPSAVCPENMEDKLTVRFRVGDVYRDRQLCVYLDGERISRAKKRVMGPGEMESVILKKSDLLARPGLQKITVAVEEAE
ncbi:NAD(P)/FAD-dependent oxidoreductase [Cuneatibacter caecimuris]|uniref:Thioredoxin reductase n=1 Tax=Cuneatibacter caecimuris TaxID=1796618 RepID=A0A4Q7PNG8_9FIRM|nr:FAD-dependent oxidoreductase [Cuneatibacter caecimuris]RZT02424.1 thioredoxin reductase [Cuneatibacter caecimuris]